MTAVYACGVRKRLLSEDKRRFCWPARRDSNPRSSESESAALSNCATSGTAKCIIAQQTGKFNHYFKIILLLASGVTSPPISDNPSGIAASVKDARAASGGACTGGIRVLQDTARARRRSPVQLSALPHGAAGLPARPARVLLRARRRRSRPIFRAELQVSFRP